MYIKNIALFDIIAVLTGACWR